MLARLFITYNRATTVLPGAQGRGSGIERAMDVASRGKGQMWCENSWVADEVHFLVILFTETRISSVTGKWSPGVHQDGTSSFTYTHTRCSALPQYCTHE